MKGESYTISGPRPILYLSKRLTCQIVSTEVKRPAVVSGASVEFVVGMVGIILTSEMMAIGNQWIGDSALGMLVAMGLAAASGGIVATLVVDGGIGSTILNSALADLLSSLMFVTAVVIAFEYISNIGALDFVVAMLLIGIWVVPVVLVIGAISLVIATGWGIVTYGFRRWWRESSAA